LAAIVQAREQVVAEFSRTVSGELVQAQRKAAGQAVDLTSKKEKPFSGPLLVNLVT
jgi:hypothetical protein